MCRNHRGAALLVAGIFFSLLALLHLIRLLMGWNIVIGTFSVPLWWSGIGLLIAGLLAAWMLTASCCDRDSSDPDTKRLD